MKKLILSLAIAVALTSCTADPIEMRTQNPQVGVNVVGSKFMIVKNENDVHTPFTPEQMTITYLAKDVKIYINTKPYDVVKSDHYTITYKDNDVNKVIEFNTGYQWQDGNTKTKFDVYVEGNKKVEYVVYTYNN